VEIIIQFKKHNNNLHDGGFLVSLRVGLLGLGNVGIALVKHYLNITNEISDRYGLNLDFIYTCDSRKLYHGAQFGISDIIVKKESGSIDSEKTAETLERFHEIIDDNKIDVLIDCLPSSKSDAGPTLPLLIQALKKNIDIICVNKAPLVFSGEKILEVARQYHTKIGLSGTTAGCLPSSGVMLHELVGSGIYQIRGILNGTSNHVLDSIMFNDSSMDQAIQSAIDLGIAEPDYAFDLSGLDTCFKMIILGLLITGKTKPLEEITRKGILGLEPDHIKRVVRENKLLRLIGDLKVEKGAVDISVRPEEIDRGDPLYAVRGRDKGITFRTKYMGDLTVLGGSSGRTNIAAAILKDIINIAKPKREL
jgi:homoserine dehydrogenase